MPPHALAERVARLLGKRVVDSRPALRGYTPAERYVFSFEDGSSAFVKAAASPRVAGWLRAEHRAYSDLSGSFMARMLAWDDDPDTPMLVLEDLSAGRWPPPWRPGDVERVAAALDTLHGTSPPASFGPIRREEFEGWPTVAREPEPFLRLELSRKIGSIETCPRFSKQKRRRASRAANCYTSTCAATTSVCSTTESCSSIGTTHAWATARSISRRGCPACMPRAGLRRGACCRGQRSLRARCRATSRPEQDSRHPEAPRKSGPSNSSNSGPRSPGRYES